MDPQTLGFALAAGLVAALNPCGFAMPPAYLTLVIAGDTGEARGRAALVGRALAATSAMALGFLVVFGIFGLVVAPLAASVRQYLPAIATDAFSSAMSSTVTQSRPRSTASRSAASCSDWVTRETPSTALGTGPPLVCPYSGSSERPTEREQ